MTDINSLNFFNNFQDAVCLFSKDGKLLFRNLVFNNIFLNFKSFERFKKRFNFNICLLSTDNIKDITPLDILLNSKENFHTICSYQNYKDEYLYYYIYSFNIEGMKAVVFKDITSDNSLIKINKNYKQLEEKYGLLKETSEKYSKLQEHAQSQVLKMGIINKISLIIRETNDIHTIINSALEEINNLLGSYKTYFSIKEKNKFRIKYTTADTCEVNTLTEYEEEVINTITEKNISLSVCRKEYLNYPGITSKGVKRIIIPVHNKNKLIGIIVTLTNQNFGLSEYKEILQSISVQLASSIIQSELIEQLNKKNKKLEKTLNELKETQLQLINSEKMASLGQLISGVAHEINTPLASINSNAGLINKIINTDTVDNNKISLLKELNSIDIEAVKRISDIVISLKRFVRLDEAQFQYADINNEIDLTLKIIHHEIKNGIIIEKKYSKLPPVLCSVNMLNQVFMNILINACHSIKEYKNSGIITITTYSENNNLIVKIKDNGRGIPSEIKDKIFTAGFTTKKKGIGSGLGLSISKKIIDLHKGSITFESESGKGSEFIITIPMQNL